MSTYTPIASQTLTGTASSITFTNIPQNFTDLILVSSPKMTTANTFFQTTYNSDTGTNYSQTRMQGIGSTGSSARSTNDNYIGMAFQDNNTDTGTSIMQINNYSNTTTNKTALIRDNFATYGVFARVALWRSTSAVTSLTLTMSSSTFAAGSTFNLYGIANASASTGKASGGNIVTTDGTYWYHTFTSSGTFTPSTALTADCLVVAGGGSGGSGSGGVGGGGGGAGGYKELIAQSLTSGTAYTVTVGAGGAAVTATQVRGNNGSNSVFGSETATGGGAGGGFQLTGNTGGSGGGGGADDAAGGTGTSGQGNNGGVGSTGSAQPFRGGGGGGASAVGATGLASGNGGAGTASSINGTSITRAGGGGGGGNTAAGTGGAGGGGAGGTGANAAGTAGTVNTGGGGGGNCGNSPTTTGAGGSGVVVVRYLV